MEAYGRRKVRFLFLYFLQFIHLFSLFFFKKIFAAEDLHCADLRSEFYNRCEMVEDSFEKAGKALFDQSEADQKPASKGSKKK
jgi:hypothetical protein